MHVDLFGQRFGFSLCPAGFRQADSGHTGCCTGLNDRLGNVLGSLKGAADIDPRLGGLYRIKA